MAKAKSSTLTGRRWQFGGCEFDEISRTLTVNKEPVRLEPKPLDVLIYLLEHPTETVSKEELLERVWGSTSEQSLAVAISKLRKAFGGERDAVVLNIAGVGYRLAVPVVCILGQQPAPPSLRFEPGQPISNRPDWTVLRKLSRDETSPVWLAQREGSSEQRVFKFATDGVHLRALQREVIVARVLERAVADSTRWAVRILDRDFDEPPYFIASEYAGVDLLEWSASASFKTMQMQDRVLLAADIAEGVGAAHAVGILHNDLKPSNLLISPAEANGGGCGAWRAKIADFGVASMFDAERLREMEITDYSVAGGAGNEPQSSPVGTVMYRAPELHGANAPTLLGDVYALGVLLYQIIIGDFTQPLSPGWEARIPDPILREDIAKAADVDPAQRLVSASELASRLRQLEARRLAAERAEAEQTRARDVEEMLKRARVRRPWMIFAFSALFAGLCLSVGLSLRELAERKLADGRLASLEQIYGFVARDLLGQANPYLNVPGVNVPGQTLLDAIHTALPRIDQRFAQQPEIAGRLHATIADAFRARAQFPDADREYRAAAERFRQAQGKLSPDAVLTELKREDTQMVSLAPGAVDSARQGFPQQQALLAQLPHPSTEVQAWAALVRASLIGFSNKPSEALEPLREAIRIGESTPGFDPFLLITLQKRICGIYLRMGDGANAERVARDLIRNVIAQSGPDSPTLAPLEMYVQEGLYLQGRYRDAIAQADINFAHFTRILPPNHDLTLGTFANRAASEGQLGLYADAARDDLKVYNAESSLPSPSLRFKLGSLGDAAMYECHAGQFQAGREHARIVMRDVDEGPKAMPVFAAQSRFTLAECSIAEREAGKGDAGELDEAEKLLDQIDPHTEDLTADIPDMAARIQLARARIAWLRHDVETATRLAAQAAPAFQPKDADPYEKASLRRVLQQAPARAAKRVVTSSLASH